MVWRTTFITISTCFLLGTTFTHWIADHDVLWKTPVTDAAIANSVRYYSLLASAPPFLLYAYLGVGCLTLLSAGGRMVKMLRGGNSEVVFDGGSVVLLLATVYTQLSETLPTILVFPSGPHLATAVKGLASDNIRCAVMLTGIMALQAGRYYAKRSSRESLEQRTATPFHELTEAEALGLK